MDLVLTDPPYHDDVQYGELARLFHVWMRQPESNLAAHEKKEAVPNRTRGATSETYELTVEACLRESRRTLRHGGRLILTFHNRDIAAWTSLTNAIAGAGFGLIGLATVTAENGSDHSKRGKQTFLCDLVIECVRWRRTLGIPALSSDARNAERKNLLAMGLAMAQKINGRREESLHLLFEHSLQSLGGRKVLIH